MKLSARNIGIALGIILAIIALFFFVGITHIGPGYEGVKIDRAGRNRQVGPTDVVVGYVVYNRLTTQVIVYPVSIQRIAWEGDEEVSFNAEGVRLAVGVAFSARVKPGESYQVVQKYRNTPFDTLLDGYIRDIVRNAMGIAASRRDLLNLLTTEREDLVRDAQEIINRQLAPDGFEIAALSLTTDFTMPERISQQINGILEAQNYAEEQRQRVEATVAEADSRRERARGEADATRIRAEGEAERIRIRAEADAQAIEVLSRALADNPRVLELRTLEKWNGQLPQVLGSGEATGLDLLVQPRSGNGN